MATGSDDSEFAEFNSYNFREELRRKRAKLKRKETSSGKGGDKSFRYRALRDLFSFAVLSGNAAWLCTFFSARTGRRGRMGRMGEKRKRGSPFFSYVLPLIRPNLPRSPAQLSSDLTLVTTTPGICYAAIPPN
jgi:hypothetical protein